VTAKFLGRHTPYSERWYEHARLVGEVRRTLGKKVLYRWVEVQTWIETELARELVDRAPPIARSRG
jgi:hypothetical protein